MTQHNHQVIFGRKEDGCPRCDELKAGAPVRQQVWRVTQRRNAENETRRIAAIRSHDFAACAAKNVVCTHFDW